MVGEAVLVAQAVAGRLAATAVGAALAGSGKPFVTTSGAAIVARPGRTATEDDAVDLSSPLGAARGPSEDATLALAARGVRALHLLEAVDGVLADQTDLLATVSPAEWARTSGWRGPHLAGLTMLRGSSSGGFAREARA